MSEVVIKVEELSKEYRLGTIGTGTLSQDLNHWWAKATGKEHRLLKIGEENDHTKPVKQDHVWALKDISFEVKQGDVLGVIGRNGAGKSTLLKLLSRVTRPTRGSIRIKGRIASLLEVGTGFHPELTGRENIFLNGAILGMTKKEIRSRFDEIVDFAGVEKYIDTPVKRYSSGMYVRLAFAVAAHLEPEILIVDEVLAVGDAEFQKKCLGKMQNVSQKHGRTILFVSHNMAAIKNLCNSALLLKEGWAKYNGAVADTINMYLRENPESLDIDLEQVTNRSGNGKVIFSKFWTEDTGGKKTHKFFSGDTMVLVFELKTIFPFPVKIDLGFSIHSILGDTYAVLYSSYQHHEITSNGDQYIKVKCILGEMNLSPGRYYIKGRMLADREESDWIKDPIGFIDMEMGDFYGTGRNGTKAGNIPMLIKGIWQS